MKKIVLLMIFSVCLGYFISDLQCKRPLFQSANATVAGMDSYDLKNDYDFKKAVKYIVENNCEIVNYGGHLELDCR